MAGVAAGKETARKVRVESVVALQGGLELRERLRHQGEAVTLLAV